MGPRTSLRLHPTTPAWLGPSPLQGGYAMGTGICVVERPVIGPEVLRGGTWRGWMGQPARPLILVVCSSLGPSLSTEARSLVDEVCRQAHSCSSSHASRSPSVWQGPGPVAASTQQLCGTDVTWAQCSHMGGAATGFDGWAARECGSVPPCCPHL